MSSLPLAQAFWTDPTALDALQLLLLALVALRLLAAVVTRIERGSPEAEADRFRAAYFSKERHAREIRKARIRAEARARSRAGEPARPAVPREERRHRATLGLAADAALTPEAVRTAYRRLIVECHPDRHAARGAEARRRAEERAKALTEAYAFFRRRYGF